MTFNGNNRRLRWGAALVAALAATACSEEPQIPVDTSPLQPEAAAVTVGLEVSSLDATPGAQVGVAIRAEGDDTLAGLQGIVRFDHRRLRFSGQVPDAEGTLAILNDADAGRGELRMLSMKVNGLPARAAVLSFVVLDQDYTHGLRYEVIEAVSLVVERVQVASDRTVRAASDLAITDARRLSFDDWAALLYADELSVEGDTPSSPGQYLLNLRYGDANLSGTITGLDAAITANAAVGNNELIIGTDSPNRDFAVAANVRPSNLPGLGEVSDANPPGRESNGTRVISGLDAVAIANEAVLNEQAIVGDLVPGRGVLPGCVVSVTGPITNDTTWTNDCIVQLEGIVHVGTGTTAADAATVTIEEGTKVQGNSAVTSALFVNRNGRIVAIGTPLEPITFTCSATTKTRGCWGGIWIAGNARLNETDAGIGTSPVIEGRAPAGGCNQKNGEGGATVFGGCNDADSSGVIRYAVIEYAGFILSGNNELNGLSLGGVGSGTDIDHVQIHAGLDDGIEFFGGTLSVSHLLLTANSDDSFDCSFGWSGNAQFIIIQHDSLDADKGIECDNTETAATFNALPRTSGRIWNLTFVGPQAPASTSGVAGNNSNDAFHLRRGTRPQINNSIVLNSFRAMDIDDAASCDTEVNTTGLGLKTSLFAGHAGLENTDADPTCPPYLAGITDLEAAIINDGVNSNTVQASSAGLLRAGFHVTLPDFRPVAGSLAATLVGATPPAPLDVTATYLGAVAPANATGSNLPWYSGWTRGWQSLVTP